MFQISLPQFALYPAMNSLQFYTIFRITRRVFKPSPPSRQPRSLRRAARDARHWSPECQTYTVLVDFCAPQKSSKNNLPKKLPQNLKSRTPARPSVDFGITFGVHLGIDVHEILDFVIICENHRNAFIQSISVGSAHPKSHIFSLNFDQKFISFLMPHSGPHFSTFWRDLAPKRSILGPHWRPAGSQMAPKIAQVAPQVCKKVSRLEHYLRILERTCFQYHFWSVPGHRFGRFGIFHNFQ